MFVSCDFSVLSGRGFCVGLRPTGCAVSYFDSAASITRRLWPTWDCYALVWRREVR